MALHACICRSLRRIIPEGSGDWVEDHGARVFVHQVWPHAVDEIPLLHFRGFKLVRNPQKGKTRQNTHSLHRAGDGPPAEPPPLKKKKWSREIHAKLEY